MAVTLRSVAGSTLLEECLPADVVLHHRLWARFAPQRGMKACGPASLAMSLGALGYFPGEAIDEDWVLERFPDKALVDKSRKCGVTLQELGLMLSAVGVSASVQHADELGDGKPEVLANAFRSASARGSVLVANYHMTTAGQPRGAGHCSPISAYNEATEQMLVLDTWFKTEPSWLRLPQLWAAMLKVDEESGRSRGWLEIVPPQSAMPDRL